MSAPERRGSRRRKRSLRSRRGGPTASLGVVVLLALGSSAPRISAGAAPPQDVEVDSVPELLRGKPKWSALEDVSAPFPVRIEGETIPFAVTFHLMLPGESAILEVPADAVLVADEGRLAPRGPGRWAWIAPETPGIRALRILGPDGGRVDVALLVAHPARRITGEVLNGYRIGSYRKTPLRGDPAYLPPTGFVEVGPGEEDIRVSPHFTLGEFLCKQPGDPRYLVLSRPLLVKLEELLTAANEAGLSASGLTIMSGFRTPFYNRSIGNTTDYSRHLWGDAADVFVDEDGDGEMDDLNGDGRRDVADARVLARVVEALATDPPEEWAPGGLAVYRRNPVHGPFVHVDARGVRARW